MIIRNAFNLPGRLGIEMNELFGVVLFSHAFSHALMHTNGAGLPTDRIYEFLSKRSDWTRYLPEG
jgi:hypothetical protein